MRIEYLKGNQITEQEFLINKEIAEKNFNTAQYPEQMNISEASFELISKKLSNSLMTVKVDGKVVGSVFILPCSKNLMNEFISKKITERSLYFNISGNPDFKNFEALYLCGVSISPEYRRRGLAFNATVNLVRSLSSLTKNKIELFYWEFSKEGRNLAEKVARSTKLSLRTRKG